MKCTLHGATQDHEFNSAFEAYIYEEVCDYAPIEYVDSIDDICNAVYSCYLKSDEDISVSRLAYYIATNWDTVKEQSARQILADSCFWC